MNKYGHEFYAKKKDKSLWIVYTKKYSLKVTEAKTKKEALLLAENILIDKGREGIDKAFKSHCIRKVKARFFDKVRPLFKETFGFDIPLCRFSMMLGGKAIDAIRFDSKIGTPNGVSTYDFVERTYGAKAKKLLTKLI